MGLSKARHHSWGFGIDLLPVALGYSLATSFFPTASGNSALKMMKEAARNLKERDLLHNISVNSEALKRHYFNRYVSP